MRPIRRNTTNRGEEAEDGPQSTERHMQRERQDWSRTIKSDESTETLDDDELWIAVQEF